MDDKDDNRYMETNISNIDVDFLLTFLLVIRFNYDILYTNNFKKHHIIPP